MMNVRLRPQHRRQLARLWMRLTAGNREDAEQITRRQLSDIVRPDGTIRASALPSTGRWEPVSNGDSANPEIVFDDGDVVMEEIFE